MDLSEVSNSWLVGTLGTTDMAIWYLERSVIKLVMLVENEWLTWYAMMMFWVRFHDREPLWMIEKFRYVLTYWEEPFVEGTLGLRLDLVLEANIPLNLVNIF